MNIQQINPYVFALGLGVAAVTQAQDYTNFVVIFMDDMGDDLTGRVGKNARPAGVVKE